MEHVSVGNGTFQLHQIATRTQFIPCVSLRWISTNQGVVAQIFPFKLDSDGFSTIFFARHIDLGIFDDSVLCQYPPNGRCATPIIWTLVACLSKGIVYQGSRWASWKGDWLQPITQFLFKVDRLDSCFDCGHKRIHEDRPTRPDRRRFLCDKNCPGILGSYFGFNGCIYGSFAPYDSD